MTILNIYEQHKGRGGTGSFEATTNERVFLVQMDVGTRTTYYVGNAVAALGLYVGHINPDNAFSICKEVDVKNDIAPTIWKVTCKYSTLSPDRKDDEDPDLDPIQIDVGEENFTRPAVYNRDGEAILTSSGTRPNPPVMVEDTNRLINIEGSWAGTGFPAWESGFRNRINSDSFSFIGTSRVVSAKRAQCKSITFGKVEYRGGNGTVPFRSFKITVKLLDEDDPDFDEQTSFLDASFQRKPTASEISAGTFTGADRVDIKLPDGSDPKEPVLLDGSGQPKFDADPATAYFRYSKTLYLATFGGNLPGCV
jgi:hypothetical protein